MFSTCVYIIVQKKKKHVFTYVYRKTTLKEASIDNLFHVENNIWQLQLSNRNDTRSLNAREPCPQKVSWNMTLRVGSDQYIWSSLSLTYILKYCMRKYSKCLYYQGIEIISMFFPISIKDLLQSGEKINKNVNWDQKSKLLVNPWRHHWNLSKH